MQTYFARPRVLYTEPLGVHIDYPCELKALFEFEPAETLTGGGKPSRTVALGSTVRHCVDFGRAETWIETDQRFDPVSVTVTAPNISLEFKGSALIARITCQSRAEVQGVLEAVFYSLPLFLSIDFRDSPIIAKVTGVLGGIDFAWGPEGLGGHWDSTTTEIQEERLREAVSRFLAFHRKSSKSRRQLLSALHYYHIGTRLSRVGSRTWEFQSETILNFSKVLETLFPGASSADAARGGLRKLGVSDEEIEAVFVPCIYLRNQLDVAHPKIAVLSYQQACTVHAYCDILEEHFHDLLATIVATYLGAEDEEDESEPQPDDDVARTLDRIATTLQRLHDLEGADQGQHVSEKSPETGK